MARTQIMTAQVVTRRIATHYLCIRPITGRHSLFPRSCASIAIDGPCGPLSPRGAIRVFHVPLAEVRRVRCLLSIGRLVGHEDALWKRRSHLQYHFGSSALATGSRQLSWPVGVNYLGR